jgi:hypothetical protein
MAREVDWLIFKKSSIKMNITDNHIRCICHKIALILNASLKSIHLSDNKLVPSTEATLGFVPGLASIPEELEDDEEMDHFEMEDVVLAPDGDNKSDDDGAKDEGQNKNNCTETKALEIGTNRIDKILKKVDFVIQRIASSAAKQSEYTTWCKKLNFYGPNFIAGYRIQWNIKFQSRDRAYNACKIIRKLIENKKDRQERDGGKNYYNNVEITRAN